MRRYEYRNGTSNKFWHIDVQGVDVTVTYGRMGTSGQTRTKSFKSEEAASAYASKQIAAKQKKGYREVGGGEDVVTLPFKISPPDEEGLCVVEPVGAEFPWDDALSSVELAFLGAIRGGITLKGELEQGTLKLLENLWPSMPDSVKGMLHTLVLTNGCDLSVDGDGVINFEMVSIERVEDDELKGWVADYGHSSEQLLLLATSGGGDDLLLLNWDANAYQFFHVVLSMEDVDVIGDLAALAEHLFEEGQSTSAELVALQQAAGLLPSELPQERLNVSEPMFVPCEAPSGFFGPHGFEPNPFEQSQISEYCRGNQRIRSTHGLFVGSDGPDLVVIKEKRVTRIRGKSGRVVLAPSETRFIIQSKGDDACIEYSLDPEVGPRTVSTIAQCWHLEYLDEDRVVVLGNDAESNCWLMLLHREASTGEFVEVDNIKEKSSCFATDGAFVAVDKKAKVAVYSTDEGRLVKLGALAKPKGNLVSWPPDSRTGIFTDHKKVQRLIGLDLFKPRKARKRKASTRYLNRRCVPDPLIAAARGVYGRHVRQGLRFAFVGADGTVGGHIGRERFLVLPDGTSRSGDHHRWGSAHLDSGTALVIKDGAWGEESLSDGSWAPCAKVFSDYVTVDGQVAVLRWDFDTQVAEFFEYVEGVVGQSLGTTEVAGLCNTSGRHLLSRGKDGVRCLHIDSLRPLKISKGPVLEPVGVRFTLTEPRLMFDTGKYYLVDGEDWFTMPAGSSW